LVGSFAGFVDEGVDLIGGVLRVAKGVGAGPLRVLVTELEAPRGVVGVIGVVGSGAGEVGEEGAVQLSVELEVAGEDVKKRGFDAVNAGGRGGRGRREGGGGEGEEEGLAEAAHISVVLL
jgi:hypothetical protein